MALILMKTYKFPPLEHIHGGDLTVKWKLHKWVSYNSKGRVGIGNGFHTIWMCETGEKEHFDMIPLDFLTSIAAFLFFFFKASYCCFYNAFTWMKLLDIHENVFQPSFSSLYLWSFLGNVLFSMMRSDPVCCLGPTVSGDTLQSSAIPLSTKRVRKTIK